MAGFWFEVKEPTTVVGRDGSTSIGRLDPGRRYKANDRNDHWAEVTGPDGQVGFAPVTSIIVLPDPPEATAAAPPPPPPIPAAAPPPPAPAPVATRRPMVSASAVLSLIFGIIGFGFPILSIVAVILGHVSLGTIKRSQGRTSGRGLAIAGLILGYLSIIAWAALILYGVQQYNS